MLPVFPITPAALHTQPAINSYQFEQNEKAIACTLQSGALLLPDLSFSTARAEVPQSAQGRTEYSCRIHSTRNTWRSISTLLVQT